jgi:hypothetical protein
MLAMATRKPRRKNPAAVTLARRRAAKLTPEERSRIARKAVQTRWAKVKASAERPPAGAKAARKRGAGG